MGIKGIRSNRMINRATCGGEKKAGLVPRHGYMLSGVSRNVVLGRESTVDGGQMPKVCVASTTRVKVSYPFSLM
jgi:hypothetical protein